MSSPLRAVGQALLGSFLVLAGVAHLTFARTEFRAQVPPWFPADADLVVLCLLYTSDAADDTR